MLEREWRDDVLDIVFDFGVRTLAGERDCQGKMSVYRGPILYGYDLSLNPDTNFESIPSIPFAELNGTEPCRQPDGRTLLKLDCGVVLSDFRNLGRSGSRYTTWLPVSAQ